MNNKPTKTTRFPAAPGSAPFLPINRCEMEQLGWDVPDFVYVSGDAYVDHPSFGPAIITRVLEAEGFRVAMLAQPDWHSADPYKEFGRPRYGFLVSAGNIDSMVAHYTVSKRRRDFDYYSPGGKIGLRPDRATIVYCNRIREAYGNDIPIILGGLEASLRRFAHYDYWDNKIRHSILFDSSADILTYGMGENIIHRIANLLRKGVPVRKIRDVRGTCFICDASEVSEADISKTVHYPIGGSFEFEEIQASKEQYARAFGIQYKNQDSISGKALLEYYNHHTKVLVQNPPMPPLEREELDKVYALPYSRTYHPSYEKDGGIPGIEEVRFSITHNRGCFGACNFCALAFHQGRTVRSRSIESVVREATLLTQLPDFKGYIHDVGGPTANFRHPACKEQLSKGVCSNRKCLSPQPCKNLIADHSEYVSLLEAVEAVPGVKKVFIRSGIRFDYLLADKDPNETFFRKLVKDHVSGQLKVAPEHCSDPVLECMGKPNIATYEAFKKRFFELSKECGKEQYLIPYLMSSHPGSTLNEAVDLAVCLQKDGYTPEQVQDYYPTPGTASTVMYYTGINPLNGKPVYVATDAHEKQLQRALLQFNNLKNASLVQEALQITHRHDLRLPSTSGHGPKASSKTSNTITKKQSSTPRKTSNKSKNKNRQGENHVQKRVSKATVSKK